MRSPTTYREKLADPRWQKRRLEVLEYADWRCQICGNNKEELHCHHSYYERGKEPWQSKKGAIICVCHTCHGKLHPKKEQPKTEGLPDRPFNVEIDYDNHQFFPEFVGPPPHRFDVIKRMLR